VAHGHGGGAARPNTARPRRSRPCRGAGRRACSPRARRCSEFGQKDTLRRRTAVAGGDDHGGRDYGECNARVGQQATLGAPRGLWTAPEWLGGFCAQRRRWGHGCDVAARHRGADRGRPVFVLLSLGLNTNNFKIWIDVHKTLNTKVVDLITPYNFHKGQMGFFSTNLAKEACQLWMSLGPVDRRYCQLTKFFTFSPSKFQMSIYMKIVSLNKLDNFHKGRLLSVKVNFGECGKSSGRHLGH
jgi:hypothetical protein